MTWATIVKSPDAAPVAPSLLDYERVRATFAWAQARAGPDGGPGGGGRPLRAALGADGALRERAARPRRGAGRARLRACGPHPRPLRRRARRPQGPCRVLPALLRVRPP